MNNEKPFRPLSALEALAKRRKQRYRVVTAPRVRRGAALITPQDRER